MSFDSPAIEKRIDYNYEIVYEYAQTTHTITKDAHRYRVVIGDQVYEKSYSAIRNLLKRYRIFPQRIIAFYSGANNKIANMIYQQNNQYASKCRDTLQFFIKAMDDDSIGEIPYFLKILLNYMDLQILFLIYLYIYFVLLTCFLKSHYYKNMILHYSCPINIRI